MEVITPNIREYQAQLFAKQKLSPGAVTNHLCAFAVSLAPRQLTSKVNAPVFTLCEKELAARIDNEDNRRGERKVQSDTAAQRGRKRLIPLVPYKLESSSGRNLAEAVVGEPIRSSWWGYKQGAPS